MSNDQVGLKRRIRMILKIDLISSFINIMRLNLIPRISIYLICRQRKYLILK